MNRLEWEGRRIYPFGTCVKLAMETAECPIDFDDMKAILENKFGVEVVLGTHTY